MRSAIACRAALVVYSACLRLLLPAYVLRLLWRSRAEPLYRHALPERLGCYGEAPSSGWIWVHAVSLGETRAALPLVQALRRAQPGWRLLLTHTTATGREAGRALLAPGDRQAWLPLDMPGAVRRFLRQFSPRAGLLMETEVWPNVMREAQRMRVPMVLVNARLSERSLRKGRRLSCLLEPAARGLTLALAQTPEDAERLRLMGVRRVEVSGNLKYDLLPDAALLAVGAGWRDQSQRPIVMAASTREGEEAPLLHAWVQALPPEPTGSQEGAGGTARPRLLLVPRHPQRFDEVALMVQAAGLTLSRRSAWGHGPLTAQDLAADVWLGDSVGEMPAYYAAARLALLGGSFAPLGGQNLIEAAACGCPLVMGPHTFNFAQASEDALAAGAALRVSDVVQAVRAAVGMSAQDDALALMSAKARAFAARDRGATERTLAAIVSLL